MFLFLGVIWSHQNDNAIIVLRMPVLNLRDWLLRKRDSDGLCNIGLCKNVEFSIYLTTIQNSIVLGFSDFYLCIMYWFSPLVIAIQFCSSHSCLSTSCSISVRLSLHKKKQVTKYRPIILSKFTLISLIKRLMYY